MEARAGSPQKTGRNESAPEASSVGTRESVARELESQLKLRVSRKKISPLPDRKELPRQSNSSPKPRRSRDPTPERIGPPTPPVTRSTPSSRNCSPDVLQKKMSSVSTETSRNSSARSSLTKSRNVPPPMPGRNMLPPTPPMRRSREKRRESKRTSISPSRRSSTPPPPRSSTTAVAEMARARTGRSRINSEDTKETKDMLIRSSSGYFLARKSKNPSQPIERAAPKSHNRINVLVFLKEYTTMLKYGKWGAPQRKDVRLDADGSALEYTPAKKEDNKGTIPLASVTSIQVGRKTKNFKRFSETSILDKVREQGFSGNPTNTQLSDASAECSKYSSSDECDIYFASSSGFIFDHVHRRRSRSLAGSGHPE
mmetsp:Transcript_16905/g.32047  ORF Transcript_16905/g.32047 Transcript_16905/m.32047 type:complete len:370 (+) Transcript_16905:27-1136(+)